MPKQKISHKDKTTSSPKIPKTIIITGKFLQSISTSLATKFAIFLFKTPMRFKTPDREKIMAQSAQNEMLNISEISKNIMIYRYGYSKRKILLVHGWSGRGTQMYKLADKFLENGFMTISFDGPAHGQSTGKTTMMNEFITSIKMIEEKHGPFEIAVGHSLGGMAVLNAIKQGLDVKKTVIIGSGDIISDIITNFLSKLELSQKIGTKMKQYFLKKFGENIDNYSASVAATDVNIPVLVVHDTNDKEVPVSCAYNIRKYLKKSEILVTNDLGHTRILKDNFVINRVVEFCNRN